MFGPCSPILACLYVHAWPIPQVDRFQKNDHRRLGIITGLEWSGESLVQSGTDHVYGRTMCKRELHIIEGWQGTHLIIVTCN